MSPSEGLIDEHPLEYYLPTLMTHLDRLEDEVEDALEELAIIKGRLSAGDWQEGQRLASKAGRDPREVSNMLESMRSDLIAARSRFKAAREGASFLDALAELPHRTNPLTPSQEE